jgi:hypothetical protein
MAFEFWRRVDRTDTFHRRVQAAARQGLPHFLSQLENIDARRGFWRYILDKKDFSKWPNECKKALLQKAWYEGFTTLTHCPQAMILTLAATSLTLFALSFVVGGSLTIFTCLMTTALICAGSYLMDSSDDELDEVIEDNIGPEEEQVVSTLT